jgi:hypothetical protein
VNEKSRIREKRSPIEFIGGQKLQTPRKKVSNETSITKEEF